VKLSARTIGALGQAITGDGKKTPYRSGPDLVRFFNEFGSDDYYPAKGGFPTRFVYAEGKLRDFNDTRALAAIVTAAVDPRIFIDTSFSEDAAVEHLNQYLKFDGFRLQKVGLKYAVVSDTGSMVVVEAPVEASDGVSLEFIHQQVDKCRVKLSSGDFDGAITNARSLLEAVLAEMERRITGEEPDLDGDVAKQYKRVQKLLNLEPKKDFATPLNQVLTGLASIVHGIAGLRNSLGDAHARRYAPQEHHARLAVNAANTRRGLPVRDLRVSGTEGHVEEACRSLQVAKASTTADQRSGRDGDEP